MRFLTYDAGRGPRSGVLDGNYVYDLHDLQRRWLRARAESVSRAIAPDLLSFIEQGSLALATELLAFARETAPRGVRRRLRNVRLLAPIPRPRKNVFCMGRNYAEHAREGGNPVPEVPVFFTKPPTAVIGPHDAVTYWPQTQALDYEAELVAVIGQRGRNIPPAAALDHVFGYTVMNDVTGRDVQRRHLQWFKGKGFDTFCPMGPWIVTADEIANPQNLRVRSRVNGEIRQDASTETMVFSVADLIAGLSAGMTLEPGDLLATGTPEGVGMGFDPPKWLKVGDVVECEVEGIGTLRNEIVAPIGSGTGPAD